MNPEHRTLLPKIAFTGFVSRYQEPKLEEGFEDITRVDFKVGVCWVPCWFQRARDAVVRQS